MKLNHANPVAETARAIGTGLYYEGNESGSAQVELEYNVLPCDMLQQMPGLEGGAWKLIANKVHDFDELCKLSEVELNEIIGSQHASAKLYKFIHGSD